MFRLVSSGTPHLGLTGWDLLNSMALDVLLDFGYGMILDGADEKQRAEIDRSLAALDEPSSDKMVEVTKHDGTTVMVSEARLAQMQNNVANIAHMRARKG